MTLTIRPFDYSERDYEQGVAVANAVWPTHRDSVEEWKFFDQRRVPGYLYMRLVAEVDGRIVGTGGIGEPPGAYEPGKFWLGINVHPDYRGRGAGGQLYESLLAQPNGRPVRKLTSWTRENQAEGMRFLAQRGFQQVMRYPTSQLDVTAFEAARFADKVQQVEANPDVTLKTLAQLLAEDPDCKQKLYDAIWEWIQDVPTPDPLTRFPQDVWEQRTFEDPKLLTDGWFVAVADASAVADGRYVGITMLRRTDDEQLETGLTAVSRSHRRLGLATALKVKAITYAQEHGYQQIVTDNEENNPMFQLNLQLGFVPQPAGLDYVKEFDNGTAYSAV